MKKIILSLLVMLSPMVIWAAKAYRMPVTIMQSDGTQLTVVGHGDEDFHYYTTLDGVLLWREDNGFFVADVDDNGDLLPTTVLAHNANIRKSEEMKLVAAQKRSKFYATMDTKTQIAKAKRIVRINSDGYLPHIGSPKVLVVLAEFSDVKFTVNEPKKAFDQYLNADVLEDLHNYNTRNYGSVSRYFSDVSFGAFKPQFDVYGPITLDQPLKYYGAGSDNMNRFIPDVCKAVDADVNFKDYDSDGDGVVDLIYIIYAGYSESWTGNPSDCIWPKSGSGSYGTYDGVRIYRYGVNNELNGVEGQQEGLINGIGLFCHEFSHCMGMPDLYVTSSNQNVANADNQQMEYWSIMDGGTYLNNGYNPPAYTAWEREAFGWLDIETLNEPQLVVLKSIDQGGTAYRIFNDNDATGNEYYIVENIQNIGWNKRQFGHGMLVMHVDYDDRYFSLSYNSVNNVLGHPRMTVLAADGCLDNSYKFSTTSELRTSMAGDPFPGTSNVTELTDLTAVKPIVYTGSGLGKPIYDIKEDSETGIVSFCFLDKNISGVENAIVDKSMPKDNRIYTIDGRCVGTDSSIIKKGIYIINNKKVVF